MNEGCYHRLVTSEGIHERRRVQDEFTTREDRDLCSGTLLQLV